MKVIVMKGYEVEGCRDCPHAVAHANFDSYDENDYKCNATEEKRLIQSYVFLKSDLPDRFPRWCPLKRK